MTGVSCSVCGKRYDAGSINVLYHHQDLWFLSVFCQFCHTSGLVAALVKDGASSRIIGDLTEAELAKFMGAPAVTANDLLDVHAFLDTFDGDFAALFGEKDSQD